MKLKNRIDTFASLGEFLNQFNQNGIVKNDDSELNTLFFDAFKMQVNRAQEFNGWFTKNNVLNAIESWSEALSRENLEQWTNAYHFEDENSTKTVGIVMAGNIPLVGFHDLLSVLICGHKAVVKLSSNDKYFLPLIVKFLEYQNKEFQGRVQFLDENLSGYDAVIATGSSNTARYFEHYFASKPAIIRKSRNSVAILTGKETNDELEALGKDIFQYFGLGCRSVSKLFVPKDYNFDLVFKALYKYNDIINYKKYENNYDYNKAVYLMSQFSILENGFVMLKEDSNYGSPIASIFYEYYDELDELYKKLRADRDQIQCIVSNENVVDFVKFGESQSPKLWNYADNIDTIEFLLKL